MASLEIVLPGLNANVKLHFTYKKPEFKRNYGNYDEVEVLVNAIKSAVKQLDGNTAKYQNWPLFCHGHSTAKQ